MTPSPSAASRTYHVCAYENCAQPLLMAGTSEQMSAEHYRSLKTKEEGLAYFGILPSDGTGQDVTSSRP